MGVEAFLISSSLEGVLAQTAGPPDLSQVPNRGPGFAAIRERMEILGGRRIEGVFYHGTGCEECRGTGYRGRIGIFELLAVGSELRELILQKRSNAELKAAAQRTMLTMHQDALLKGGRGHHFPGRNSQSVFRRFARMTRFGTKPLRETAPRWTG